MTNIRINKNEVKLLAAAVVLVMAFASFGIIYSDSDEIDATTATTTVGDSTFTVTFNTGMTSTVNGSTIKFTGVAYTSDTTTKPISAENRDPQFGDRAANYAYASIKGFSGETLFIKQTNSALSVYSGDENISNATGSWVKTGPYNGITADDEIFFLIPKDGSSVVFEAYANTSATGTPVAKITLDFSKVSTKILLDTTSIGNDNKLNSDGWKYTWDSSNSKGILNLKDYNGSEVFTSSKKIEVKLEGTNSITNYGIVEGDSAIITSGNLSIILNSSNSVASLGINVVNNKAFGIQSNGTMNIGSATTAILDLDITGSPNRGIYAVGVLTTEKATIDVIGTEKAIRVGGGTSASNLIVGAGSTINATLCSTTSTNGQGLDDLFGIKTEGGIESVATGARVNTQGLYVNSIGTINGIVVVSGGYTQNPNTSLAPAIAGLYYNNLTDSKNVYTETVTPTSQKGIYLANGAEYFGKIAVYTNSSATEPTVSAPVSVDTEDKFNTAVNAGQTVIISDAAALPTTTEVKTPIIIDSGVSVSGKTLVLTSDSPAITSAGGTITNSTIRNGNATMVLTSLTGTYTISYGSIEIDGTYAGTIKINSDENKISGEINNELNIQKDTNVLSNDLKVSLSGDLLIADDVEMTIDGGVVLVIPEGKTLTVDGTLTINSGASLVIYGALVVTDSTSGAVTMNGSWAKSADATVTGVTLDGNKEQNILRYEGATGIDNTITGNTEWATATYLSGNVIIEEGVTVTIGSKGYLDLCGNNLIVKGTLIIQNNGYITNTTPATGKIYLTKTGDIQNNGVIGMNADVTIAMYNADSRYTGLGSVTMNNVNGIEIGYYSEYISGVENLTLMVSGDVSKKAATYKFTMNGAVVDDLNIIDLVNVHDSVRDTDSVAFTSVKVIKDGSLTIGSRAEVKIVTGLTLTTNATLNVDGKITGATVSMVNGAVANINGNANSVTFSAKTGEYRTYNATTGARNVAESILTTSSTVTLTDITALTIEITSKTANRSDVSYTTQMLNLSGSAAFVKAEGTGTAPTSGTAVITGDVYVPADKELILARGMTDGTSSGKFVTEGTLKVTDAQVDNYKGAAYSVKMTSETGSPYYVYIYTTFNAAISVIDSAESKTVTISGGYTFAKDYTIKANQTVQFTDTTNTYKISKDATVTVEKDGTLSNGFSASGIQGILVVMDGATCTPSATAYQVKSTDSASNITYSGAAVAIENASEGDVIDIVSNVEFSDKVTVPKGVTVKIAAGKTVDAQKGLSVNGKVENNGTVKIGANYDLDVAGEFDNNQTVTFLTPASGDSSSEATITGKYTGVLSGVTINAAKYTAEGEDVYTSVSSAIAAVTEMSVPTNITVTGEFSESSDVIIPADARMIVKGDLTISSITLSKGSVLEIAVTSAGVAEGKITGDIIASVGKADTTGAITDAVINTDKVTMAQFSLVYNESTTTSTMYLTINDDYTGSVVFEKGSVTIDTAAYSANDEFDFMNNTTTTRTMSIASDATVVVKNDLYFKATDKKCFINQGTISVKNGMTFENIIIGGNVVVDVEKTIALKGGYTAQAADTLASVQNATEIIGTITLSEKEGKDPASATITGAVLVGTSPETLGGDAALSGKVSFSTARESFVVVFDGASFSTTVENVKFTAYTINDDAFATIYGNVDVTAINPIVNALKDLDTTYYVSTGNVTTTNIIWKNGNDVVSRGTSVGTYETVNASLDYAPAADFTISAGPGLIVYIDDLRVNGSNPSQPLRVGTHTVTVYVEPDYEGTPSVVLNGKAVTNGSFEITTEMLTESNLLVVTGATPVSPVQPTPTPTPVEPSEKDDSMGITEYLLIVLVVLAAILVVVVAIRMMRS